MLDWTQSDGVCELVLDRQPCNEIGTAMLEALEGFLDGVNLQDTRALVIRSAVPGGFCAGADLRELYQGLVERPLGAHEQELRTFLDRIHDVMNRLDALPLVTIGMIHGVCFGGGFELALTCDVLIAERTARFCFPELRLGIIPGFGGIPRLRRDVGNAVVRDLLLTGRSINAKKAQGLGLVSQVVASGEGRNAAMATARQAAKFDDRALRTAKAFIKPIPYDQLELEKQHFITLARTGVLRAALQKFVESDDLRPYLP